MKQYRDTETGKIMTEQELKVEFEDLQKADPDTYDYTFSYYIRNITGKGATNTENKYNRLSRIPRKKESATIHKNKTIYGGKENENCNRAEPEKF